MSKATGLIASPIPLRSYDYELCRPSGGSETLPDEYILPEDRIPDIYDQGDVGACVGFSTCSCAESHFRRFGDTTRLSPGFTYCRKECRGNYEGYGLYADYALKGLTKIGFVPYVLYPILKEVPEGLKLAAERDDLLEAGKERKPSGYAGLAYALEDKTWENIRRALAIDNSALLIISHDYFNGGSHAVMGIGYTNKSGKKKGRYVTFQNSWGKNWSVDGRSEIPVSYVDEAYIILWDEIKFPFIDVKESDWFFDEVRSVYLSGLVAGTTETTFEPNAPFIRGDVAVIVSRMLDKFEQSMNTFIKTKRQQGVAVSNISFNKWAEKILPFNDVKSSDYYYKAITDVYANGIMEGKSDTEFDPMATMTRAEVCTMAVRIVETIYSKIKTAIPANYTLPNLSVEKFVDVDSSRWYYTYVQKACRLGIMNGNGDGTFAPEKNIVRCEGAAIFHRLFKTVENLMMQAV